MQGHSEKHPCTKVTRLTEAQKRPVIRENLDTENMQYVFVTRDAEDLRQRLTGNQSSPMVYDSEKPTELLDEDKLIETISLGLDDEDVTVIPAEEVFN